MEREYELAQKVVELASYLKVVEIITFAATPLNITHHAEPGVLGVSTRADMLIDIDRICYNSQDPRISTQHM